MMAIELAHILDVAPPHTQAIDPASQLLTLCMLGALSLGICAFVAHVLEQIRYHRENPQDD